MKALSIKAADRFQSMEDFKAALTGGPVSFAPAAMPVATPVPVPVPRGGSACGSPGARGRSSSGDCANGGGVVRAPASASGAGSTVLHAASANACCCATSANAVFIGIASQMAMVDDSSGSVADRRSGAAHHFSSEVLA